MSLVITGTNLIITFFMLIAMNGFFCLYPIPLLGIPIAGISLVFILGFPIDFSGIIIILSLMLLIMLSVSLYVNIMNYRK